MHYQIRFTAVVGVISACLLFTACGGGGGGGDNDQPPVSEQDDGCSVADKLKGSTIYAPDFNGDGCEDLAIGAPSKDLTGGAGDEHGQVTVIYGTAEGLLAEGHDTWHRGGGFTFTDDSLGDIDGDITDRDRFGKTLAWGDFNGDGYSDLAISIVGDNPGGFDNAGSVQVIYGSAQGLRAINTQFINQGGVRIDPEGDGSSNYLGDIFGGREAGDSFGSALVAGNFNGDNYFDLAVGVVNEDVGSVGQAGAVNVIYGSENGLIPRNNQFISSDEFRQENDGAGTYTLQGDLMGTSEARDFFGFSLASGDINNDGNDDLVVGTVNETITGGPTFVGAVHIIFGSDSGLVPQGHHHFYLEAANTDFDGNGTVDSMIGNPFGVEDQGDFLGWAVAVGDFDGDLFGDVAVGAYLGNAFTDTGTVGGAGAVYIWRGSDTGLTLDGERHLHQGGINGQGTVAGGITESGDGFGFTFQVGDFNGDSIDDLAIGAPEEDSDVRGDSSTGAVSIWFGSDTDGGLNVEKHVWITPDNVLLQDGTNLGTLVVSESERSLFGHSLSAADFNDDGRTDLAIGIPNQPTTAALEAGAVAVIHGTSNLQLGRNQLWSQEGGVDDLNADLGDLRGSSFPGDDFGWGMYDSYHLF